MNAYDYSLRTIDGDALPLETFKGKAVLLVNTASACGLTPQYEALEELYRKYQDRGLVVLGVPSNDFGGQEPGTEADIKQFCALKFNIEFPLASKEKVAGAAAHPLYRAIASELGEAAAPKWNFHKYLIGRDGALKASFGSRTVPDAPEIVAAIEAALA
ncbi:glutathione peroxidase [Methylocella silvestris BL2]|uniref:Glutathione peroxidase n=1 Tax=Methylocella silvestris (strain DSM 15510 / CIP 108128 / LMG 27833 / NCIMB 13906 / BL2) TaxID=395965 RepID=B8EKL2_METSB|nr:glutathione peroxidase [Methylocella silvestris]ACK51382.1 glutathione peroxidase [Methylocella silvestris BL2]